jgi:hypothetical protein
MRLLAVAGVAVLVPCCVAQTKAPPASPTKPVACQTVMKCRAELKEAQALVVQATDTVGILTAERDKLVAANVELQSLNTKLATRVDASLLIMKVVDKELRYVALSDEENKAVATIHDDEILKAGIAIEKDQNDFADAYKKLSEDHDSAVRKYNALLSDYKDYVTRVGIQMAAMGQANRISNALALYNAMPKYTPPQQVNVQGPTAQKRLRSACIDRSCSGDPSESRNRPAD